MSLIRKHGAVLQAWACLALVAWCFICCKSGSYAEFFIWRVSGPSWGGKCKFTSFTQSQVHVLAVVATNCTQSLGDSRYHSFHLNNGLGSFDQSQL